MRLSLTETILAAALALALVFGGWNWWRKNVYYTALHQTAAAKQREANEITAKLQGEANASAKRLQEQSDARAKRLQDQLDYLAANPTVRTEYVVRDRWRTGTCPAGTPGSVVDVPGTQSGLHPELERYALRAFNASDGVVDERNECVRLYNGARAAALEWNHKHGR